MINMTLVVWFGIVVYSVFFVVPPAEGLGYLVRIAFFHIPVAWVAVLAFLLSAGFAVRYLQTKELRFDYWSSATAELGLFFCALATISGAIFAKLTWGAYWNWDPRQTTIFILLLIYGAYLALRISIDEAEVRAKISAVYALLSFLTVPFLVFIIPRYYFSLHPEPVLNGAGKMNMDAIMLYVLLASLGFCTALFWRILQVMVQRKKQRAEEQF